MVIGIYTFNEVQTTLNPSFKHVSFNYSTPLYFQEAADRGNVYAMGNLVALYYERKLFTKASDLGLKVAQLEDPVQLSKQTGCLPVFIAKGSFTFIFHEGSFHQVVTLLRPSTKQL